MVQNTKNIKIREREMRHGEHWESGFLEEILQKFDISKLDRKEHI